MNEDLYPLPPVSRVLDLGEVQVVEPAFGDLKLSVFPITHDGSEVNLPQGFELWTATVRELLALVPVQVDATSFYVTIDSKYFTEAGLLRREGVHIDGNFCADPDFAPKSGWGPTWGGMVCIAPIAMPDNSHVRMGWKIPYDIVIPIGKYVSSVCGGILAACSWAGCQAWPGAYDGEVLSGGQLSMEPSGDPILIPANRAIFMSSNAPHETMEVQAGVRRTLIRITLDCKYNNTVLR